MTEINPAETSDSEMQRILEQFLFAEARLLDEQKFEEWSALFAKDGEYWVPVAPDQPDPKNHISLMYETDLLRAVRVARFGHPNAFSLTPMPRSLHIISNVIVDKIDREENDYVVHSTFMMAHYRNDVQEIYAGSYQHQLRLEDARWKIVRKKVDLINCDAALPNILLYF